MNFSTWEPSDFIAVYAALVATFVAVWDIVRWLTAGPRLKLRVQYDMVLAGHPTRQGTFIIASVINRGTLPATLTNLAGAVYRNRLLRWIRKPDRQFVVMPSGDLGPGIPFVLEPGREWQGYISQEEEIEADILQGNLEIWVRHTAGDRWLKRRVEPKKSKDKKQ